MDVHRASAGRLRAAAWASSVFALTGAGCVGGHPAQGEERVGLVAMAMSETSCSTFVEEATVIESIAIHFSPGLDVDAPGAPIEQVTLTRAEIEDHCGTANPNEPLLRIDGVRVGEYGTWAVARGDEDAQEIVGMAHSQEEPYLFEVRHGTVATVGLSLGPLPSSPQHFSAILTVGTGTITADLTDFVTLVDLSDLPADFWNTVKPDGGDIRVQMAGDETPVPFDLVTIDVDEQKGLLFFKASLASGSDNEFKVTAGDPELDGLPVGDAYGRNAVWSAYEFIAAGNGTDRTGKGNDIQLLGSAGFFNGWLECSSGNYGRVNGLTKLTQWTLAASAIFDDAAPGNQAIISYGQAGADATYRASVVRRYSPFQFGMWNSTDLWTMNTVVTPQVAHEYRFHHVYNGTTERKLYVDADGVTDTGVAQRPGGIGNGLYLGRADEWTPESLMGRINYVYLRSGVLSPAWIAAEDLSWRQRNFYTVHYRL